MQDLLTHIATGIEVFFVGYVAIAFITGYCDRGSLPTPTEPQSQIVEDIEQLLIASDPFNKVVEALGQPDQHQTECNDSVSVCPESQARIEQDDISLIEWAKQHTDFAKKWSYRRKLRPAERDRILKAIDEAASA